MNPGSLAQRVREAKRSLATIALPAGCRLRMIGDPGRLANDADMLTRWRKMHRRAFLTEFEATRERTQRWLETSVLPDRSRMLFIIETDDGTPIGSAGLTRIDPSEGAAELDAILRGIPEVPGIMSEAVSALVRWARSDLGVQRLSVRVFEDNAAGRFYEQLGFVAVGRTPLYRREAGDGSVEWCEGSSARDAERWLTRMELRP